MTGFLPYVMQLRSLATQVPASGQQWQRQVEAALDGEAGRELRRAVKLSELRSAGAFFTGSELAAKLVASRKSPALYLDPACGAGDLLVAIARQLPACGTVGETISLWGKRLIAFDIYGEFVEAAKLRLTLLALQRSEKKTTFDVRDSSKIFPQIRRVDALSQIAAYREAQNILLNPPFTLQDAPIACKWGSGKVTSAAVFVAHVLENSTSGTTVEAILPEVLRTGSRYSRWRKMVEEKALVEEVKECGLFDIRTDVDVFILRLRVRHSKAAQTSLWCPAAGKSETVGDGYAINVGTVVPHRDPHKGPRHPYITAREAPRWTSVKTPDKMRRHRGRTFNPPFVVVRRTSRPDDPGRAAATIVTGNTPVLVENHLIVCKPLRGGLRECHSLLRLLRASSTDAWLNHRMRCRHLTVASVAEIPWSC